MNDSGNIFLFGCNVVDNPDIGQSFIDQISKATSTDVFASDDITGKGGDWDLEVASKGSSEELSAGLDTNIDKDMLNGYDESLAPPEILSAITVDNDGDGQIDHIKIVSDQNLDDDF